MPVPHTDTLLDILVHRARVSPNEPAFIFLEDGESREAVMTYAELDQRARSIACELQKAGLAGERALLLYPPGLDFVTAFYGCTYAGVIAVPAYPPDPNRIDRTLPRVQAIVKDCSAKCVLTTANIRGMAMFLFPQGTQLSRLDWLASDEMQTADSSDWQRPEASPDSVIFLQYTSGSTGTPKGVVIDNRSLLANQEQKRLSCNSDSNSVILSWVPFYHDLGLIGGVVHPVYVGAKSILMSPMDFLQKPVRWLRAITKYGVTFSAGPNFAFDMCVTKIREEDREGLNLETWTMALVGAEPISARTLQRFTKTFEPYGFRKSGFFQGYGLAEAVLSVSSGAIGVEHKTLSVDGEALHKNIVSPKIGDGSIDIVSCGLPLTDQEIIIVGLGDHTQLNEMEVGEVWVRGDNVARGYWNRPKETRETFQGYTQDTNEGPYLKTGDLGFFSEGELYITGRIKELIIIRGQNHYPTDIEETISGLEWHHKALRPGNGAAFSTQINGQDELIIMQEVEPRHQKQDRYKTDVEDLSRGSGGHLDIMNAMREAVAKCHGIQAHAIFLLWPGSMPKTSSGKIQRREAKANYESKFLEGPSEVIYGWVRPKKRIEAPATQKEAKPSERTPIAGSHSFVDIETFLLKSIAEKIDQPVDSVDIETPFSSFGLDSRDAVGLTGELQEWLGMKLGATLLFDYPSIAQLTEHLAERVSGQPGSGSERSGEHVIIIGAGVAGLTAAFELYDRGEKNITIVERAPKPGGKVRTAKVDGHAFELGQIYFGSNYVHGRKLAKRLGLTITPNDAPTLQFSLAAGAGVNVDVEYFGQWTATALGKAGLSLGSSLTGQNCPPELYVPFSDWVEEQELGEIPMKLRELWTSYGYGYLTDDIPAYYVLRYLILVFGMEHYGRIEEGNQALWERAAHELSGLNVPVLTGYGVDHVERSNSGVRVVAVDGRTLSGDRVVFACPPDAILKLIQPSSAEKEVLASFKTYQYRVAVVRAKDMPDSAALVVQENQEREQRGHLLGYFRFQPDNNIFITSQYGRLPGDTKGNPSASELQATLEGDFRAMGGELTEVVEEFTWEYFPHADCETMASGVFSKLAALQGKNRSVYLGSFTSFETLEDTAASTAAIIESVFAKPSHSREESVAIIGMACRLPGNIGTPNELWRALEHEVNAITEIPRERWDVDQYYSAKPQTPGKMCTRWGGFLGQIDSFDASFFGISPREARNMDPQQRVLLEVTHQALEDAGLSTQDIRASKTSLYAGVCSTEYALRTVYGPDITQMDPYSGTGALASVASGRLSYLLDLRGPSMTLDTACSSSLVALHLAMKSLREGESNLGIVSGVNLMLDPKGTVYFSTAGALSPDGHCKTFDDSANGYVRSEGCGVVVLKRLSDALADNDRVYAIVRGTAVNQDGKTNGLTAPNGHAQESVVRAALRDGGVQPVEVGYLEAHGTGTPLGDLIELQSLSAVYRESRDPGESIPVGALKSNIGHTEGAAGVAGLIKTALVVGKGTIPANLHFETPNKNIEWDSLPFSIPTSSQQFPLTHGVRTAGVSSFGFGGTNAHAVLSEAPPREPTAGPELSHVLLTLSAKTPESLNQAILNLGVFLEASPNIDLADVAYTLSCRRTHFSHRAFVVAGSVTEAVQKLQRLGEETQSSLSQRAQKTSPKVAFLFTGQGSQYVGMGKELYNSSHVFRDILEKCDEVLIPKLGQSMVSIISPHEEAESPIHQTAFTQPILFAFEYALAQLWRSWGVVPDFVMGHSVGEYTAACVAGVFDFRTGLALIAERGRLMQSLPTGGTMAAAKVGGTALQGHIDSSEVQGVHVAAYNGPESSVMAGTQNAVSSLCEYLKEDGVATKELTVSHAFHSHLMEPILDDFEDYAESVSFREPVIPLVSNVTGKLATANIQGAAYWREHIRKPVSFEQSVKTLAELGVGVYCEIGPHTQLMGMGRSCIPSGEGKWLGSLHKKQANALSLLNSVGECYLSGVEIEFQALYEPASHRVLSLPTYPFARERHWIDPMDAAMAVPVQNATTGSMLGRTVQSMLLNENELLFSQPTQHIREKFEVSGGSTKLPFHWFLEAIFSAREVLGYEGKHLGSLELFETVESSDFVQCHLKPLQGGGFGFTIAGQSSDNDGSWKPLASGKVNPEPKNESESSSFDMKAIAKACKKSRSMSKFITKCREMRAPYGAEGGRVIQSVHSGDQQILMKLRTAKIEELKRADFVVEPKVLDAGLMILAALTSSDDRELLLPVAMEKIYVHAQLGMPQWVYAVVKDEPDATGEFVADIYFLSDSGQVVLGFEGTTLKPAQREPTLRERLEQSHGAQREQLVVDFIRKVVAKGLQSDPATLDMGEPLTTLGLDSLISIELLNQLEADLKVDININELQEETTGFNLAQSVLASIFGEQAPGTLLEVSPLVQLQAGKRENTPVFYIHPVGGSVLGYMDLVRALGPKQPFYGLQVPRVAGGTTLYDSVEEMAAAYLEVIEQRQPEGPYVLGGWSMGASVAFEIALRLRQKGATVAALQLIDGLAPGTTGQVEQDNTTTLRLLARDIGLGDEQLPGDKLRACSQDEGLELVYQLGIAAGVLSTNVHLEDLVTRFEVSQKNFNALTRYAAKKYDGSVSIYRATHPLEEHKGAPQDLGWGARARTTALNEVLPGDHFSIMHQAGASMIAKELQEIISTLDRG